MEGAKVSITGLDAFVVGLTDQEGYISIPNHFGLDGVANITATASNYLPLEDEIELFYPWDKITHDQFRLKPPRAVLCCRNIFC